MDNDRKIPLPAGLPPLPKSLSIVTGGENASPPTIKAILMNHHQSHVPETDLYLGPSTSAAASRQQRNQQRPGSLSSTQESLSDRESVHSRASASSTHSQGIMTPLKDATSNSTCTLDTQIAILRREMYGLRQLDLSLLSQLWALHESIQGFRIFLQEQEVLSPPSPSPTASDTNSIESEPEDESSLSAPPKLIAPAITTLMARGSTTSHASSSSTSASGSSSAPSSMTKQAPTPIRLQKQHPQLPRILQQRAQRAPPPPPPTRPKQLPNKLQAEQPRPA